VKSWYVVGREPPEAGDPDYVNVFGPFMSETDARAYAMDLAEDNGWESVEAELLESEQATDLATDDVLWPYESEPFDQSGEET
jgi:hypothetical protein